MESNRGGHCSLATATCPNKGQWSPLFSPRVPLVFKVRSFSGIIMQQNIDLQPSATYRRIHKMDSCQLARRQMLYALENFTDEIGVRYGI